MVKALSLKIQFYDQRDVYYPGQILAGYLDVDVRRDVQINYIAVQLIGQANSSPPYRVADEEDDDDENDEDDEDDEDERTDDQRRKSMDRIDINQYQATIIDRDTIIWGKGNKSKDKKSNQSDTLNAGRHRLPFAFVLPEEGLPSSVKAGSTFTINYQINSIIVFPHRPPFNVHRPFFIFEVVDVNLPRYVKSSPTEKKEIRISRLCCLHESIRITVSTNHVGFRPGEPVCINVRVQNNSHKVIRYLRAKLIQIVEIKAKHKHHNRTIEHICSEKHSIKSIMQDEDFIWEKEPLQIPSVPPSVNSCPAISINYVVEMEAVLPTKYHLAVRVPITVGTVRLYINASPSVRSYRTGVDTHCRLDGSESAKQQLKGTISDAVTFKDVELGFNERRQASL